jgi:hypothetical protein
LKNQAFRFFYLFIYFFFGDHHIVPSSIWLITPFGLILGPEGLIPFFVDGRTRKGFQGIGFLPLFVFLGAEMKGVWKNTEFYFKVLLVWKYIKINFFNFLKLFLTLIY